MFIVATFTVDGELSGKSLIPDRASPQFHRIHLRCLCDKVHIIYGRGLINFQGRSSDSDAGLRIQGNMAQLHQRLGGEGSEDNGHLLRHHGFRREDGFSVKSAARPEPQ
jgi:hypothetical protein